MSGNESGITEADFCIGVPLIPRRVAATAGPLAYVSPMQFEQDWLANQPQQANS